MGVPKFQHLGLSRLWGPITSYVDLRLRWGLKQSCSPRWEISNGVLHSTCMHRDRVDSQLLVVGSQIANLTPSLSFCHNLCYKCPNGSCKPILTSTLWYLSNDIKNTSMQGVLTLAIELWSFGSPSGLPSPHFGSEGVIFSLFQSRVATIEMFDKNLLLDLHKMWGGISNRCCSSWCQNNIMKFFWKIFCNDLEPFGIYLPFQTEVTNDRNLKNISNNIIVSIICIILGDMNNF